MITYILNTVFFLWVLVASLKQKKYTYTVASVISLLYFVFDVLQKNYNLIASSHIFGNIQKIALLILTVYLIVVFLKSPDRKKDFIIATFAVIACLCRFLRTIIFNYYTGIMNVQTSEAHGIFQNSLVFYYLVDSVTRLMLILIFFCMAWQLGKPKVTNS